MSSLTRADAQGLCNFVDLSPSPFHVCATVAAMLADADFDELTETQPWPTEPGRYYVIRGGSLIAWTTEGEGTTDASGTTRPFRIVGGHTDSPNLRVKQHPDLVSAGWRTVGLEPYGGAWLNSWLDRDLGVSGRLTVRNGGTASDVLVHVDDPILRVPQLAIHLSEDRKGVQLDRIQDAHNRLQFAEGEADKVMLALVKDLYNGPYDAKEVVILMELYDLIETAIDRARDAGQVVLQIMLKYS